MEIAILILIFLDIFNYLWKLLNNFCYITIFLKFNLYKFQLKCILEQKFSYKYKYIY